jgi:hypothetical protein
MPETNIIVSGPTRAAILAALGSDGAVHSPIASNAERQVAVELEGHVQELETSNQALAKELADSEAERESLVKDSDRLVEEVATLRRARTELEQSADRLAATCGAIAKLVGGTPGPNDGWLVDAVKSALKWRDEEIADKFKRIEMLEGDVRRLGAQLLDGKASAAPLKLGDLVTCTWPDGETKAPGIIRGDDPETGRFLVEYYDMPPSGSSGETWAAPEQLAHRSGEEPGDPPTIKKTKRATGKKKAEEAEQAPPIDRDHYNAWKAGQEEAGITEGLDEMEFKRLKDAGVLPPYIQPEPKVAMTVNGVPLDEKLDPLPPHTTAFLNAAAPAEVQAASRALAEFNQLADADFMVGEKVAVLVHVADGTVAVGHIDHIPAGGTMARILFLDGSTNTHHRDALRQLAPAPTPEPEPEAAAPEPKPQLTGVGAGSPASADDTDFDW